MPPKTAVSIGQPEDPSKTGFLDLAAETRNQIYGYWATSITTFLVRPKGKAYTTASHPATQISRIIHRELTGLLAQLAPTHARHVKVRVLDLDFYPLTTYLNRVRANPDARTIGRPLGGLPIFSANPRGTCTLTVDLAFTANFPADPQAEKAARFARYLQAKAADLQYTTQVVEVAGDAKQTGGVLRGLGGPQPSPMWREITLAFGNWERERGMVAQRRMEREARECYMATYATVYTSGPEWGFVPLEGGAAWGMGFVGEGEGEGGEDGEVRIKTEEEQE